MRAAIAPVLFGTAALFTGAAAVDAIEHAANAPSSRATLIAVYCLLRAAVAVAFAAFTVRRLQPHQRSRQPVAIAACTVALAAVAAMAAPSSGTPPAVSLAGELIAVLCCVWLLVSVLALGRCFGVLPEARGLVTRGPYRWVRHPVYLGEIGACAGLALAAPSVRNTALASAFIIAQFMRMLMEEQALTRCFPEYAQYAAHTPRLLPRARALRATRLAKSAHARPAHAD